MSAVSISRSTIIAYLRDYLKNRRKKKKLQQRVNNDNNEQPKYIYFYFE